MKAAPHRIAIIDGEVRVSYECLLQRAGAIAAELERRDIQPGALVGVCMKRSWELVAALIGVMRAGCAYVPLDPAYPQDRVGYMLEHSGAVAAIVDVYVYCSSTRSVIYYLLVQLCKPINPSKDRK
ncbi:AMP-binding protein (plasmid) [Microbulbifer sp. SSSA002]